MSMHLTWEMTVLAYVYLACIYLLHSLAAQLVKDKAKVKHLRVLASLLVPPLILSGWMVLHLFVSEPSGGIYSIGLLGIAFVISEWLARFIMWEAGRAGKADGQ